MSNSINKERHTKIIGNIFIVWGALSLLGSIFAYNLVDFVYHSSWFDRMDIVDFGFFHMDEPMRLFYFFPAFISLFGLLKLVAGLGLVNKKPWGEKLSIVLAFFMLFNMPLGTAFAVYIFYAFIALKNEENKAIEE